MITMPHGPTCTPPCSRPWPRTRVPPRLLLAAVLLTDLAAIGAHAVSVHSAFCQFGP